MSERAPARSGRLHVRPAFRRVAIGVLAILFVVLAHRVWDYVELRRLVREIDRIRERGEPLSGADVRRVGQDGTPSTRDARDHYAAAAMLTLSTGSALKVDASLAPVRGWMSGAGAPPANVAATVAGVHAALDEWRDALGLVDTASELPFGGFSPGTEFNYRAAGVSNLSRLVADRTIALSLSGDGERAVESAISGLRLRRPLRDVLGLPVGSSEVAAIVSFSQPSVAGLRRLQEALEQEDDPDAAAQDLVRERARHLDRALLTFYGTDPRATLTYPPSSRSGAPILARPLISRQLVEALRVWAELIEAARQPWPGRADAIRKILARYPDEMPSSNSGAGGQTLAPFAPSYRRQVLFPLIFSRQALRADGIILDRAARIAIAVERYRRDTGSLPMRLEDLVPAHLAAIPDDPWTGRALTYRLVPESYVVYSVGPDLQDNGGALMKAAPATSAARFIPADDVGVRVLLDSKAAGAKPDASR